MASPDSSTLAAREKPSKPYRDFPLYAHRAGYWAKKIRGRTHYFGRWDDWKGALDEYLRVRDDLQAGRKPREAGDDRTTVRDMVNRFLTDRERKADQGEIRQRTFTDYLPEAQRLIDHFGRERVIDDIRPEDFAEFRAAIGKDVGPMTLATRIRRCRAFFNYAVRNELVGRIRYGDAFELPSAKAQSRAIRQHGPRDLSPKTVRCLVENARSPHFRSMLLLGINGGFGNTDCAELRQEWIDLDGGWIRELRHKTGTPRVVPLWEETCEAIQESLRHRPRPKSPDADDLLFVTKYGRPWVTSADNAVSKEFRKLRTACGIERATFYDLRRTFQTIGDQTRDFVSVSTIMGHAESGMSARYRQRASDESLRDVSEYVRSWLYGSA